MPKVNARSGIDRISANHEDSTGYMRYNPNQTDLTKITAAIRERGFELVAK